MRLRTLTALLLVLAACVAVGCGADNEPKPSIPAAASTDLQSRLAEVERRMNAGGGACTDIAVDTEPAVHSILAGLPSTVDPDVRNALKDSFDHLFDLTSTQCDETKGQQTDTNTTPTDTNTTPTDTQPTDTNTTPTDTNTTPTDTNTTPTDTQPTDTGPPEQPGNSGGAQGPGL